MVTLMFVDYVSIVFLMRKLVVVVVVVVVVYPFAGCEFVIGVYVGWTCFLWTMNLFVYTHMLKTMAESNIEIHLFLSIHMLKTMAELNFEIHLVIVRKLKFTYLLYGN